MAAKTEREQRSTVSRTWHPREPHLFVVLEGDRPAAGGLRCVLRDVDEVVVGRSEARVVQSAGRTLTLGLPDPKVSTRHAHLVRTPDGWSVRDAGSTNGTFVGDRRVTERSLVDGDWIEVGRTCLRIRFALPTPEVTPSAASGEDAMSLETLLPVLADEHRRLARMARSSAPVLLLGETGAGKEVTARAIHATSGRPGAFVAINCAAIADTLVESALFGHVKGAFSGATSDAVGFVRAAHDGTLFLDEIGDLRPAAQGVLLRVLQEGEVVPVGATRPISVNVRVIAATHRPIEEMVEGGSFRHDLYARLQGFTHRLWPLRDRREDIGLIVANILRRGSIAGAVQARFTSSAAHILVSHDWPFNVRELTQVLTRATALAVDGTIEPEHLAPLEPRSRSVSAAPSEAPAELSSADLALRASLMASLERFDGNVAAVARDMNKATMQVYRWMRKLGVNPKGFR
jgi:DNA-binding NtrC family response regulator